MQDLQESALFQELKGSTPFFLMAGPNVIQSEAHCLKMCRQIKVRMQHRKHSYLCTPGCQEYCCEPHLTALKGLGNAGDAVHTAGGDGLAGC